MIAVVALLLIITPCAVAAGLVALLRHGDAVVERERQAAAQAVVEARHARPAPARRLYDQAADWDLVARQQRRDGLYGAAMLSNQWADRARAEAREGA